MINNKVASLGWSKEHLPSDHGWELTRATNTSHKLSTVCPELLNAEEFEAEYRQ
jgi:hypothetical protein